MPELDTDRLYEIAFNELKLKRVEKALWARAFAESDGDQEKAKARYINARVKQIQEKSKTKTRSELQNKDSSNNKQPPPQPSLDQKKLKNFAQFALCPKCGSDHWKLASLIHSEGFSSGEAISEYEYASVTHQTDLSKLAAPPNPYEAVNMIFGTALTLSFFGLFISGYTWFNDTSQTLLYLSILGWGLPIFMFRTGLKEIEAIKDKAEKEIALYHKKRMCLRCGFFYIGV